MMQLILAQALAAPPVRAVVAVRGSEEVPAEVVLRSETDLRALLESSGRYQLLDPTVAQGRLGFPIADLWERCLPRDEACWVQQGRSLGVDQLVLGRLSPDWGGTRGDFLVVDVNGDLPLRYFEARLPSGGGAPIELAEDMFFGAGELSLSWQPVEARVLLDDVPLTSGGLLTLPAGKHLLRVELEGYNPAFAVLMVYPGQHTEADIVLSPELASARHVPWGPWAAMALVAGGSAALVAIRDAPALAWRP